MKTKKHLILFVSVMLVSIFIASVIAQKTNVVEKKEDDKEKVEYLYVQTSHAVTFKGDKMTLHGVSPTTVFFSDRPASHRADTDSPAASAKGLYREVEIC